VILGHVLDARFGTGAFWTMTLLGLGIGLSAVEVFLALRRAIDRGKP
jgi:hypothetical protein